MKKLVQILPLMLFAIACTTSRVPSDEVPENFTSNPAGQGPELKIEMTRGEGHNHPLMGALRDSVSRLPSPEMRVPVSIRVELAARWVHG